MLQQPAELNSVQTPRRVQEVSRADIASAIAKRVFDVAFGILLLPFLCILMTVVALAVRISGAGPILYWSDRVGRYNKIFRMPKFRSMKLNTPEVASHLLRDPQSQLTPIGTFLRKTSLDELPQIYSILKGDLSFVGPRPALYNQYDLIASRTEKNIHLLVPGLTGWPRFTEEMTSPSRRRSNSIISIFGSEASGWI